MRTKIGSSKPLADLVATIYEAALQPFGWDLVVDGLRSELNAATGILFTPELDRVSGLFAGNQVPETDQEAYVGYYHQKDVWTAALKRKGLARSGVVYLSQQLMTADAYAQSEIYNDFSIRLGMYHATGMVVADESNGTPLTLFSLYRPEGASEFDAGNRNVVRLLAPHLTRAMQLHWRFTALERERLGLREVLDCLTEGVFLLTTEGAVAHLNTSASKLIAAKDGINIMNRRLVGATSETTNQLTKAIGEAVGTFSRGTELSRSSFRLPRPSGKPSYVATISPIPPKNPFASTVHQVAAVLFVDDQDADVRAPPEVLKALFGFTMGEARVAIAWANGDRAQDISEAHGTKLETVRSQIRSIHDKLGVSRQAQASKRIVKATAFVKRSEK